MNQYGVRSSGPRQDLQNSKSDEIAADNDDPCAFVPVLPPSRGIRLNHVERPNATTEVPRELIAPECYIWRQPLSAEGVVVNRAWALIYRGATMAWFQQREIMGQAVERLLL